MTVTTMQTVITPLAPSTVTAILASLGMAEIVVGHTKTPTLSYYTHLCTVCAGVCIY